MAKFNNSSVWLIFFVISSVILTFLSHSVASKPFLDEEDDLLLSKIIISGRTKRDISRPSSSTTTTTKQESGNPLINRIINFLQRKNIYKVYNLNRALEAWRKLDRNQAEDNMKEVMDILIRKTNGDYDLQISLMRTNTNITGNSVIFRNLLKFFVEASPKGSSLKYKLFDYLSNQLDSRGIFEKMSLDDSIVFTYIWIQEIINGGAIHSSQIGWSEELLKKHKERNVRTIVRAANRVYPEGPGENEVLTIENWWLRQRQHSSNVYKVYNVIHAMIDSCQKNRIEVASIYESLVNEYKKAGRSLDAFELNMIDYLSYQLFGFINQADPDSW